MFLLVRVLWRSVWVLVAVQVWVSQLLVLGLGVVGWVLLGVGARHFWLRAWWCLFASRAGVLGDADDGGALGVTRCRGRGGGPSLLGLVVVWIEPWVLAALVLPTVRLS